MAYNTKHFNHDAYYASKTAKELSEMLRRTEESIAEYPQLEHGIINEYAQTLKAKIAERIGRR